MQIKSLVLGLIALCTLVYVNGCAVIDRDGEPRLERYVLTSDVNPQSYDLKYDVKVELAPILNQGGVVMQISEVELRPAKNHRYSANLEDELKLILVDEISKHKGLDKYSYRVYISKFQGNLEGDVLLSAYIKVSDLRRKKEIYSKSFDVKNELQADGYAALVSDLKRAYLGIIQESLNSIEQGKNKR